MTSMPKGNIPATVWAIETLCSDAIQRIATLVGISVDLDDPEQALVFAVERELAVLVERAKSISTDTSECRHPPPLYSVVVGRSPDA